MSERAAVLLAGGAGTRLWPLSTEQRPKQFLPIFGGRSLLQIAFARMRRLLPAERIWISTHERYAPLVRADLPDLDPANLLTEPARRNTAPAIAACSMEVSRRLGRDPLVGIFPSDHFIGDEEAFVRCVDRAYRFAAIEPFLMTIGIEPDHPNTGYGYLELGEPLQAEIVRLQRFVEKPPLERAEEYVRSRRYLWNGGMFVWRHSTFENALDATAPDVAELARRFVSAAPEARTATYERMPSISIDFAVMEKAANVATVRGSFGWSDVGSWRAVARIAGAGRSEGVVRVASDGSYVASEGGRPIVLVGAAGMAVIDTPAGLLVIDLERSEQLAAIVKAMEPPS